MLDLAFQQTMHSTRLCLLVIYIWPYAWIPWRPKLSTQMIITNKIKPQSLVKLPYHYRLEMWKVRTYLYLFLGKVYLLHLCKMLRVKKAPCGKMLAFWRKESGGIE